ncbi:MAG TPA: hypothetical protein ENI57_08185 [Ignavibacteria bacterium]|nr:hypothetical protein [Ignavibacteria bacterium]
MSNYFQISQTPLHRQGDISLNDAEFCVIDTETTGLAARRNSIVEIGIVVVKNLKISAKYHSMINPGRHIPANITMITGITNEEVRDAPFFEDIANDITEFINDKVLTAHNLSFDKSFLRKEFLSTENILPKVQELCTVKLARKVFPELRSKSLGPVCRHLRIKNSKEHRALSDAEATAKILIKMIKILRKEKGIKNLQELLDIQQSTYTQAMFSSKKKKLQEDVSSLPNAPGIYYFLNSKNDIIYVGKAKSLKKRVKSYFVSNSQRKAKKIAKQAKRVKIEITNTELTALLAEAELIKILNPKHNRQLKHYGNKYFLRININHKYPNLEITNHFDFDGNDYFGLFISRDKAKTILEIIDKTFELRECTNQEFLKSKACFLAEIERCTSPCTNKNLDLYKGELEKVYDFLYGKNSHALERLLNKMKLYSSQLKFEKAAEVKVLIDLILAQTHKSSLLSEPVNSANVLFEIKGEFENDYLLMLNGKIHIRNYVLGNGNFNEALDDYFTSTINLKYLPTEEDLEKMKIALNWLIKNRNNVRIFYLKNYNSKEELFSDLSRFNSSDVRSENRTFEIQELIQN